MSTISRTSEFAISRPVDVLFPLFTPEGEKLWAPNWDYENVMGTTQLGEDYVFLTGTHDHAGGKAIWIVKRYEPDQHRVQYYRIEPQEKVGVVTVACMPLGRDSTTVQVTYAYTGISERGNRFVENFSESGYKEFIEGWRALLNDYLERTQ